MKVTPLIAVRACIMEEGGLYSLRRAYRHRRRHPDDYGSMEEGEGVQSPH